ASCNGEGKKAQQRFEQAQQMYERNEFFAAKNEIDSIRALYPREAKVMKESLRLMRLIEVKESERTIAYCDSLLPIKQTEAEELVKGFILEKDPEYQEIGNYVWKQQTIERNVERCYVRAGVDEKGEMYLASVYFGSRPIEHTGMKVSLKEGLFAETPAIPYDGGVNYRFKDLGNTTEVVTYKGDYAQDVVNFIYTNEKERIKVDYTGGKPYTIYLNDNDKKAIVATYDLATVLSDINNMTTTRDKATKKIDYLKGKLAGE
ncbi:MAG: hypothetical protein LUD74_07620, partial [Tannerellaceae bacterium]|nr:hypothetical protein [Tannerellaceae bacterium]